MVEVCDGRMQRLKLGDVVESIERGDYLVVVSIDEASDEFHVGARVGLARIDDPFYVHAHDSHGDVAVHGYWKTGDARGLVRLP